MNLQEAIARLEDLGVQHAPEQRFLEPPHNVYGREVLTTTPPGLYYLTSEDNIEPGEIKPLAIQLIAVNVPDQSDRLAAAIGWCIKQPAEVLRCDEPSPSTFLAAIIEPVA